MTKLEIADQYWIPRVDWKSSRDKWIKVGKALDKRLIWKCGIFYYKNGNEYLIVFAPCNYCEFWNRTRYAKCFLGNDKICACRYDDRVTYYRFINTMNNELRNEARDFQQQVLNKIEEHGKMCGWM